MQLIISDIQDLKPTIHTEYRIITETGRINHCIGCFGCWIKTPGQCVIKDGYENMGALLSKCDELLLVSKCTYGGLSPFVKNVIDRALSYISPHFVMRNGEMHHKRRYNNVIKITAYFYGTDITEAEQETAKNIVLANAINYDGEVKEVRFFCSAEEVKEVLR